MQLLVFGSLFGTRFVRDITVVYEWTSWTARLSHWRMAFLIDRWEDSFAAVSVYNGIFSLNLSKAWLWQMSGLSAQNLSRELTKIFFYFGYSVVHRTFLLSSFKLAEYKCYPYGWSVHYGQPFTVFRHAFAENTARISMFREVERVRKKFPQCSPIDPNYCSHLDLLT